MLAESTILTVIYFGRSEALIWAFAEWGGWGSNPRPADYEKYGSTLQVRCLH
jgi:hypothetical protein